MYFPKFSATSRIQHNMNKNLLIKKSPSPRPVGIQRLQSPGLFNILLRREKMDSYLFRRYWLKVKFLFLYIIIIK